MKFKKTEGILFIRFEQGEEIIGKLRELCEDLKLKAGLISAIGAFEEATLGFFNLNKQEYHKKDFKGSFEIVSLTGNLTEMDNKPYLHIHACLGDADFNTYGGHLDRGIVSATCEMIIVTTGEKIDRFKGKYNLNLLKL